MNEIMRIPAAGRVAGIDFGTVRIGLAITDPDRRWVSPLVVYTRRTPPRDADYFQQLAREQQVVGFVVGLPVHLSGKESVKSRESRQFGAWLHRQTQLPVEYFDERFSSHEAREMLDHRDGLTGRKKRQRLDAVAAQVLLQAYLDARSPAPHVDGDRCQPLDDAPRDDAPRT